MSTKTLRKRIALATVVALGAGVLSLVSTTAANASDNSAPGTAGPSAASGVLNIGTQTTAANGLPVTSSTAASNSSVGLLAVSDIAGNRTAGLTQTATLLNTGKLVVYTSTAGSSTNSIAAITVSGGTIVGGTPNASAGTNGSPVGDLGSSVNSTLTTFVTTSSVAGITAVTVVPNSGATTMTVQLYNADKSTSGIFANLLAAPATYGTLNGKITVSLVSASLSGTVSLTNSAIYYTTKDAADASASPYAGTSDATVPIANQPAIGVAAYNVTQYGVARIRDAYAASINAGSLVQATASNGALVDIHAGNTSGVCPGTNSPTKSTAFVTSVASVTQYCFAVVPSVSTSSNTVVSITVDGTLVATKSFTFYGKVAKVILGTAGNGKVSTSSATSSANPGNSIPLSFQDDAGNILAIGYSGFGSVSYTSTVTSDALTTGVSLGTIYLPGSHDWVGGTNETAKGYLTYKCSLATNVSGQLVVDYTNLDGTVVTSNAAKANCSGAATSFTAAWDKSTYKPGDIATLTVTFKDSTGSLAADNYTLNGYGAVATSAVGATAPTITASNMTATTGTSTNAATATDAPTNGVIKYTYIVGTTTGSYGAIVSYPAVQSANVTASYSIADGSTSLNDVLKGIVDLIASINKQIAALAKLVTKKK
jgi:trimeric autotransporter adhesin